jgi:transposase
MSYSLVFRKKILQVQKQEGLSYQEVAKRFGIGKATVTRWRQRLQPKKYTLKQPRKIDLVKLAQDVRDYPDDYQYERAEHFGVKQTAILYALRRLGIIYKKNTPTPKGRQ